MSLLVRNNDGVDEPTLSTEERVLLGLADYKVGEEMFEAFCCGVGGSVCSLRDLLDKVRKLPPAIRRHQRSRLRYAVYANYYAGKLSRLEPKTPASRQRRKLIRDLLRSARQQTLSHSNAP